VKKDALKQVEVLLLALIGLSVLWFVSLPTVNRDLTRRAIAGDLVAWLVLKQSLADRINKGGVDRDELGYENLPIRQPAIEEGEACVAEFIFEQELSPGGAVRNRTQVLRLIAPWPDVTITDITLCKTNVRGAYSVLARHAEVPYERYWLFFNPPDEDHNPSDQDRNPFEGHNPWLPYVTVIRAEALDGQPWEDREFIIAELMSQNWYIHPDKPYYWQEVLGILSRLSGEEPSFDDLRFNIDALKDFLSDSGVKERSILGVPVRSGMFFTGIGVFLGAIAFALVGPIAALHSHRAEPIESHWSVTTKLPGILGAAWNVILVTFASLMLLVPLLVAGTQVCYSQEFALTAGETALLYLGYIILGLATIVIAATMRELWCLKSNVPIPKSDADDRPTDVA
jgi:hypothetical protein